jgi:hypothetical protein
VPAVTASPAAPAASPSSDRTVEIRLTLSTFALRTLSEPRVRHLIEIETEDVAVLAPGPSGPLGDHVAYVWVDQPTISKVVVEARVGDHPVERREIAVRGLAGDVAARLVAIAVSETVRAGMAPRPAPPPPPPPPPPRPTAEEMERAARASPAVMLGPAAALAVLPAASGVVAGPSLAVAFRDFGASEAIFARWLTGAAHGGALRWLEIGLSADYRFWLGRSFRLALGGQGAFSSVHVGDALGIEGQPGQEESWSARAGGFVALEARLAAPFWLSLSAEPGAILRPVHYTGPANAAGAIGGAWLGFGLTVHFEHVLAAPAVWGQGPHR